jgi:hypothetical protein
VRVAGSTSGQPASRPNPAHPRGHLHFYSASDAAAAEAAENEIATARRGAERAAAYVARSEHALAQHAAGEAAARRAKLERRKAEIEASLEMSVIDARARPLDEQELGLFAEIVEVRLQRVLLKQAGCEARGELVRVYEALGLDTAAVERSLSIALSEPTHSHHVLEELGALAESFGRDDHRRQIASDLSYAVVVPRAQMALQRHAAE